MNDEYTAYLDPIIALVYIVVLVWSCVPLVRDSCLILLQTIPGNVVMIVLIKILFLCSHELLFPGNVEISLLKKYLLKKFPGILSLHEFHTWTFTPGTLVLTGHIMYQVTSEVNMSSSRLEARFPTKQLLRCEKRIGGCGVVVGGGM